MITKEPKEKADDVSSVFFVTPNKKIIKESTKDRPEQTEKSNLEETMIIQGDENTHKSYQ